MLVLQRLKDYNDFVFQVIWKQCRPFPVIIMPENRYDISFFIPELVDDCQIGVGEAFILLPRTHMSKFESLNNNICQVPVEFFFYGFKFSSVFSGNEFLRLIATTSLRYETI